MLNPRQQNPAPLHGIPRPLGKMPKFQPVSHIQSLSLSLAKACSWLLFVADPSATKEEVLLAAAFLSQAIFLPSEHTGWATRQGELASTPSEEAHELRGKEPTVYLLSCH